MVGLSQAKQNRLRGLFEIRPCDWVTAATDQPTWVDARDTLTSKNSTTFPRNYQLSIYLKVWSKKVGPNKTVPMDTSIQTDRHSFNC